MKEVDVEINCSRREQTPQATSSSSEDATCYYSPRFYSEKTSYAALTALHIAHSTCTPLGTMHKLHMATCCHAYTQHFQTALTNNLLLLPCTSSTWQLGFKLLPCIHSAFSNHTDKHVQGCPSPSHTRSFLPNIIYQYRRCRDVCVS